MTGHNWGEMALSSANSVSLIVFVLSDNLSAENCELSENFGIHRIQLFWMNELS